MSARHLIQLPAPAAHFHDGFPLGNGALGAMLHGRAGTERFDLNLDTLWSGGPLPAEEGPAPSRLLPELREVIRKGDFLQADALARRMQGPGWTESYQPLGRLDWCYAAGSRGDAYGRELDLAHAIATTRYHGDSGPVELSAFVSAPANVLVASATGDGPLALPSFTSPHPGVHVSEFDADGARWLVATGRVPAHVVPNYVDRHPATVYADDEPGQDGTVAAGMGFAVAVALQRTASGEVRLIASAAGGFRGFDQRPSADLAALAEEARGHVASALTSSTQELRAGHIEDYRGYFDRVDLDLSDSPEAARAELFYHYGRYLLISSSRPGTQAANLQGIWNADVRPGWSSNYTTNINVEMNYWPAEPTGLQELHGPMLDLIRDLVTAGATTADRYYGAAGSAVHHNTDIWRFTTPVVGEPWFTTWPSGLLWLAAHAWDHREYGGDGDLALPVLRAATEFALDLLVPDENGRLVMSPSTSPEHRFLVEDSHAATSEGAAMDQELIREVLTRYTRLASDALAERARSALALLRPVAVGDDGALLEWYDERSPHEPGHRHVSHLYGLYPGTRITESGTPRDFDAARRALRTRLENGSGHTGWSQAWILCLAARLRDAELAERSISILLDELSSESLLDLHPHPNWPGGNIFQIDGNFGAVAGMTELLVQSHEQLIGLLKTLPPSWHTGSVRGIRCRGGHRVDLTWTDGTLTGATITVGDVEEVVVEVPDSTPPLIVTDGRRIPVHELPGAPAGRRRLSWATTAHARYHLAPE
ncbi:glycosyl hydrolase family 95 catalytic domain-containing protein [Nonomuraea sp. JJY05]|uniref:glycoside hydrolase family 95 protein n=1 Tax=Nonomuraea sp. JJY05 TaxID=3350255 RepID=UPI00373E774B